MFCLGRKVVVCKLIIFLCIECLSKQIRGLCLRIEVRFKISKTLKSVKITVCE